MDHRLCFFYGYINPSVSTRVYGSLGTGTALHTNIAVFNGLQAQRAAQNSSYPQLAQRLFFPITKKTINNAMLRVLFLLFNE